jgi:abortive infection bacteriophage resistance protein
MSQPYTKPWLSYSKQVQLLQQRGLVVADVPKAERFLTHLSYYRFSGYCLAFESARHQFEAGATFEQVVESYGFDLALRDLITEALEVIEIDLRAAIAYRLGDRYGAFGHIDANHFFPRFDHNVWLSRLQKEAERSNEEFVNHFKRTYSDFPDLPIWIATEVMSFGSLSRMFMGMKRDDQKAVAKRYGLQGIVLESWMHHGVYIRNLCAHHSRVWDRVWAIKPRLPSGYDWQPPALGSNQRLYSTLLLLRYLLKRISAVGSFAAAWKSRVETHLETPPSATNANARMGLTNNWASNPIWK